MLTVKIKYKIKIQALLLGLIDPITNNNHNNNKNKIKKKYLCVCFQKSPPKEIKIINKFLLQSFQSREMF